MKTLLNKKIILEKLETSKRDLSVFGVKKIGLFGSYTRGENTVNSDLDFLVEFAKDEKTYFNFLKVCDYLENIFGENIEVVTPESLSRHISPYVKEEVEYA